MNVELKTTSALATFRGSASEINRVEDSLVAWARQLGAAARQKRFKGVWSRVSAAELVALTGAVLDAGLVDESQLTVERLSTTVMSDRIAKQEEENYLRWYQAEAVRAAVLAPLGRGIIKVPTGGGKTRIAISLARAVGGRWVYLVPNMQLAKQTQAQAPDNMYCSSFGSISSLALQNCVGVIIDECHRIAAKSWVTILGRSSACWRVGLSATPILRQDSRNTLVVGILGSIIYSIKKYILEEEGFLAKGTFKTVKI